MNRPSYPSDLTDAQWTFIEPHLPAIGESTFCETVSRRELVNGVRYVLRSGVQWRMLPHDLPNRRAVYFYHDLWAKNAVWERVNAALVSEERERKGRKAEPSAAVCDSQSVETTQKGGLAVTMGTKK